MLSPVSTHEGHTPVSDLNCMLRVGRGPRCAPWTSSSASPGMKAAGKAGCQVPPGCSTQRPARVEHRTGQQSRRRRSVGERPVSQRTRSQVDVGNHGEKDDSAGGPWFVGPAHVADRVFQARLTSLPRLSFDPAPSSSSVSSLLVCGSQPAAPLGSSSGGRFTDPRSSPRVRGPGIWVVTGLPGDCYAQ